MFSILQKLIEKLKLNLNLSFLNRTDSPSLKIIGKNKYGDNIGGNKTIFNISTSEPKSKIEEIGKPITVIPEVVDDLLLYSSIYSWTRTGKSKKHHKCSNCEFGFYIEDTDLQSILSVRPSRKTVACPNCRNVDSI